MIELRNLTKRYPGGLLANDQLNLQIQAGTIHAIVGENGAGKTTLMNMLYGLEQPTSGTISINGQNRTLKSPLDAIALGIGMVHQHFMLFESLTVAENVVLGAEPTRRALFDQKQAIKATKELADRYRLDLDPRAKVRELPVGLQQRVEILKVLYRGAATIILDEPTAVLTPNEADELLNTLKHLKDQGKTILFISHKLPEVLKVADQITVMRGGRIVGQRQADQTTAQELATLMVGELRPGQPVNNVQPGAPTLELKGLSLTRGGRPVLQNIDLEVRAHEIVGVAGVAGNGQTELLELITGLQAGATGQIRLNQTDLTHKTVRQRRDAGLAYVPDDRYRWGAARGATLVDTAAMGSHHRTKQTGWLKRAEEIIATYQVKTLGPWAQAQQLSGGNLQKLIVGRELSQQANCLLIAEPSRGVDLAAAAFIHERILERKNDGAAILLVSSDLTELLKLADRIVVIYQGQIVGELPRAEATEEQLGLWMAGGQEVG